MIEERACGFVAECYWPDASDGAVRAADERIATCAAALDVRYLGSVLLHEDEVVLCQFEGTAEAVREVVACAEVPFERILESTIYRAQGGIAPCSTD
jgi:hypothetical protein